MTLTGAVLSLSRAYLNPYFSKWITGRKDVLTGKIAGICSQKLGPLFREIRLKDEICPYFQASIVRRGLGPDEMKVVSEAVSRGSLHFTRPFYLEIKSYGFGLSVYRVFTSALPSKGMEVRDLIDQWRRLARAFSEVIRHNMDKRIKRLSLASKFLTEVLLTADSSSRFGVINQKLIKDHDAKLILSPLKNRNFPRFKLVETPDPAYISTDGVLSISFYYVKGRGRRRNVHQARRKKRKYVRAALEQAIGLKIFLENEDVHLKGVRDSWGAWMGMVYLNPKVVRNLWMLLGGRFDRVYSTLLDLLDLNDRFLSYWKGFWFPFRSDGELTLFLKVVSQLGAKPPEPVPLLPLDDFRLDILRLFIIKDCLDTMGRTDKKFLALAANFLCDYMIMDLEVALQESQCEEKGECSSSLLKKIMSRYKYRGLTLPELVTILSLKYKNAGNRLLKRKKHDLLAMSNSGILTFFDIGRRGRGPSSVRYYLPNYDKYEVRKLKEYLQSILDRIADSLSLRYADC